jgi:hypothetical protein
VKRPTSDPPELRGFEFVRVLGSGGFSDVFLYEQQLPRRQVAVKVLLAEDLTAANRAAFVAEANVMARLSAHPYIVSIFHADVSDDGRPYFIMEYYGGPSLGESYKVQPLSVAEALRAGVRIASAIATAHASGILHRDIKPANVLTNEYGWPGVTDFGISSTVDDELPAHTSTHGSLEDSGTTGQSVGLSVPWSPPEMFDDDPKPDVRSDVFSLAATIYTLLAGRTPFEVVGASNQAIDLMARIERGAITAMKRTDVPASLLAVLRKGMSVDRGQRFASAVDFARALQRVELELSYAATPIEVPNLTVPEAPRIGGDPADETRARPVTTVAAQAPSAPAPIVVPTGAEAAETRMRAVPSVDPRPVPPTEHTVVRERPAPETPDSDLEAAPRRARRGMGVLIGVLVGVALIAGVITAVVWGSANLGTASADPTEAPVDDGGPVVAAGVPTPVDGAVTPDASGTSFTFTWANPDPQDGDRFVWWRTDGAGDDARHPTADPTAVVSGVPAGTNVCIDVSLVRDNGEESGQPLAVCVR